MELERLFRVSPVMDIFNTDADPGEQNFFSADRKAESEVDFGLVFQSACEELKAG